MGNVIVDGSLKRKTEQALLVDIDGKKHWLPISKLSPLSEEQIEHYGCRHYVDWQTWQNTDEPAYVLLSIPEWLAARNGIQT